VVETVSTVPFVGDALATVVENAGEVIGETIVDPIGEVIVTVIETTVNAAFGTTVTLAANAAIAAISGIEFTVPGCNESGTLSNLTFCDIYSLTLNDLYFSGEKFNVSVALLDVEGIDQVRLDDFTFDLNLAESEVAIEFDIAAPAIIPTVDVEITGRFNNDTTVVVDIGAVSFQGAGSFSLGCNEFANETTFALKVSEINVTIEDLITVDEVIEIMEETIGESIPYNDTLFIRYLWEEYEELILENATALVETFAADLISEEGLVVFSGPPCFQNDTVVETEPAPFSF